MAGPWDALVRAAGSSCDVYDSDGVTYQGTIRAAVSNAQLVRTTGQRGEVVKLTAASEVSLAQGWVVHAPDQPAEWYLIAKRMHVTRPFVAAAPALYAALALPLTLTFVRRVQQTAGGPTLDVYDEPLATTTQAPDVPAVAVVTMAGVSTVADPLGTEPEGPTPSGAAMAYVPLGVDVRLGDQVTIDERSWRANRISFLAADGTVYARRIDLEQTTGQTALP